MESTAEHGHTLARVGEVTAADEDVALKHAVDVERDGSIVRVRPLNAVTILHVTPRRSENELSALEDLQVRAATFFHNLLQLWLCGCVSRRRRLCCCLLLVSTLSSFESLGLHWLQGRASAKDRNRVHDDTSQQEWRRTWLDTLHDVVEVLDVSVGRRPHCQSQLQH